MAGDAEMQGLQGHLADGAIAVMQAAWLAFSIFVVITAALLTYSGTFHTVNGREIHSSWVISIAFIIGAVFSATAGFIGMKVATKANVRTTQAARTSLKQALKVSFTGGTVMGLGVAGLAVLGLGGLFIAFLAMFKSLGADQVKTAIAVLTGFALGAESSALCSRVGGGFYSKAAGGWPGRVRLCLCLRYCGLAWGCVCLAGAWVSECLSTRSYGTLKRALEAVSGQCLSVRLHRGVSPEH